MLTTTCYLFNLLPNDGMTQLKVVFNQIISQSFSLPSPIICPKKKVHSCPHSKIIISVIRYAYLMKATYLSRYIPAFFGDRQVYIYLSLISISKWFQMNVLQNKNRLKMFSMMDPLLLFVEKRFYDNGSTFCNFDCWDMGHPTNKRKIVTGISIKSFFKVFLHPW